MYVNSDLRESLMHFLPTGQAEVLVTGPGDTRLETFSLGETACQA